MLRRALFVLFLCASPSAFSQTYTIQTFAGGGLPDAIAGVRAGLDTVGGVAVDPSGNVYISLSDYNVVMCLNTSGQLSRVAGNGTYGSAGDGGAATAAQLATPGSLALDAAGHLYIADTNNLRVRMVANATISTVVDSSAFGPNAYPGASALARNDHSLLAETDPPILAEAEARRGASGAD